MKTFPSLFFILPLLFTAFLTAAENTNDTPQQKIVLQKGEKPLAQYVHVAVPFKPYIDELRTPSGKNIIRDAPSDHLHHHGLMYAIKVNGCNFWEEFNEQYGKQNTRKITFSPVQIESELGWTAPEEKLLLQETRKISVDQANNATLLDWQSTFKAAVDTVLGGGEGGHYHGLGMRFVEEMDKDGRFFNSTGKTDGEVTAGGERLTPCRWMAYMAKVERQPVTVAVFDHPSNPVPMTAFTMGDTGQQFAYISATMNMHRKPIDLRAGQTMAVKYRVAVWDGEVSPETVEERYREFVR
ncbi:MAG: PmoA family protein [Planctomycetaceae bacterium]|jgi:hypothetical protein|nr:PmoA family protein [Planctomycetaceae bacterium]